MTELRVDVLNASHLSFDDGAPVRAASGITRFESGWLVVSDDATHAALWCDEGITRLRVLPPVHGHDLFDEASGTKHLKPDLEAACLLDLGEARAALLLGSGSLRARMRGALVEEHTRHQAHADLHGLYRRVALMLGIPVDHLNVEGACVMADRLRWFQRGNVHLGLPSASVDVDLAALVAAIRGEAPVEAVVVDSPRIYELGAAGDAAFAVTDALALPDGRVLIAVAGEDTPNAVDDGPVVDSALTLLDGHRVLASASLPPGPGGPEKVEGLALVGVDGPTAQIVAVIDADDPSAPSRAVTLAVTLPYSSRL